MGYVEGTEKYALYDALLGISCKGALYLDYLSVIPITSLRQDTANQFVYTYKTEIEALISDLLSGYGIGFPDSNILPFERADASVSPGIETTEECTRVWKASCQEEISALHDLYSLFEAINGYEYRDAALAYLSAAVQKADYAMPYIEDFFYGDTFDIKEEYDKENDIVRIIVTTTCDISKDTREGMVLGGKTYTTLGSYSTVESYIENADGTNVLTWTLLPSGAMANHFFQYNSSPGLCNMQLINSIGITEEIYYHSEFPYAYYSDEFWDNPVKASLKELDECLSKLFFMLKGDAVYTYRDLSTVNVVSVHHNSKRNFLEIQLINGGYEYLYPEYFEKNVSGRVSMTVDCTADLSEIPEYDRLLFMSYTSFRISNS